MVQAAPVALDSSASTTEAGPSTPRIAPKEVLYCPVCTYPAEFCEFGASLSRCKAWLEEEHPKLFQQYYSEDAITEKMGTLSVEKQEKLEHDVEKMEKKARKKEETLEKQKMASKITIKRIERNKRKYVTTVLGLETFGIDLKKASKIFAQKFATGSSVTKNPQGQEDITVQGDVTDEIADILLEPSSKEAAVFGKAGTIPENAILKTEEKKKKEKPIEIAPQHIAK
ncbi:density-regulated protein DRP1 [Mrakia frigida]|uniref:Tma22p n=1 Tax=Mrakia frigida TaxID=29902 RepID=UPI003FCC13A4